MKQLFLFLLVWLAASAAFAQTGDSTEVFEPAPFRLSFASYEDPAVTGKLALTLTMEAQVAGASATYQGISDSKNFFQYDAAQMRARSASPAANGSRQTVAFQLAYDPNNRPFFPVRVQVQFTYAPVAGGGTRPYQRDAYIYFTPYNTVEVWDQTDYENLQRAWLTDDGRPASARVFVPRSAIPVSDIPAGYQAASGEEFDREYVEGLAYAVPRLYPNFPGYNDGTGQPNAATAGFFNFNVYRGQITNQRIFTFHKPDGIGPQVRLPLRRGRVEVWWDVNGGSDQHVKTFYTDSDGYLNENGSRTVQFAFPTFGTAPQQMYLRIKMQDQWSYTKVWGPWLFSYPLTTDTPRQPLAYNANAGVFANLSFGQPSPTGNDVELPETQGLKPFTWIMACRDQVWNALSGNSLQGSYPLVVLLTNNADEAFYRASDRGIRLGANTRTSEFVPMHELGHFVMHDLTRANSLPGPGGSHTTSYNNHSAALTMTEGFADGFAFIMDEMTYQDLDRESGQGGVGDYHPRATFGAFNTPNLTSPYVSEFTLGAIMLDLWDGPNNLAAVGNPLAPGFYEDNGDAALGYVERYEMPLLRILSPLFYTTPNSISEYFAGFLRDNATNWADNQRIREVWYYNFNSVAAPINAATFRVLNMDEIDPWVRFTTPKFDAPYPGTPAGTLSTTYRNTDLGVLSGSGDSFNVTTYVQEEYDYAGRLLSRETKNANGVTLTDPLRVTNGAELGLHSGAQPRWQNRPTGLTRYTKRTNNLDIALRAQARLTIENSCQMYIGSIGPYQTATVGLYEGTYLVLEKGATLTIEAGSTLNIWNNATLLVRNGATLKGDGSLFIRAGGHICVEDGGNVLLSTRSTFFVDANAQMGVAAGVGLPTSLTCTNKVAACGAATIQHSGVVNVGGGNEALQFDGDDVVSIPNTNSYVNHGITQQFAVEAFIRADNLSVSGAQTIFSSRHFSSANSNGYDGILFSLYGGQLLLQLNGVNYYAAATRIPNDNGCHHVAVTRDNTNRVRFYIDGQETAYTPTSVHNANGAGSLSIGADNCYGAYQENFWGMLGEVRVWNSWRTAAQIRDNLTVKLTAPQAGLVVYYDMQDATGSQQLSDLSGVNQSGQSLVPGVLGATSGVNSDDPSWVAQCALACTVQGNFRTASLNWTPADSTSLTQRQPAKAKKADKAVTNLSISPNPTTNLATIHFEHVQAGLVQVWIQDLAGNKRAAVLREAYLEAGPQDLPLSVQELPAGLYLLVVQSEGSQERVRLQVE